MKRLLLMFVVSAVIYFAITALVAVVWLWVDPYVPVDGIFQWERELFAICNIVLTAFLLWLIFKRTYKNYLVPFFITIITSNFLLIISNATKGSISTRQILLALLSFIMFLALEKKVNEGSL